MKLFWRHSSSEKSDNKITLESNYTERISDIKKIFDIFHDVLESQHKKIELDFSNCNKISITGINILAALGPLCYKQKRHILLEIGNNQYIYNRFKNDGLAKNSKAIPFRKFDNETGIISTLEILKTIPDISNLPQSFYNEIWSRLYELCSNANEHGKNDVGAVCNGFCDKGYLTFSVFDFGKGITNNVNEHLNKNLNTTECIKWALEEANSTKQSLITPRGAGFSTTIDFIKKYKGKLVLCTGDIYCIIKNNNIHFQKLNRPILGTLITISICIKV